jgi:hypothetical protein
VTPAPCACADAVRRLEREMRTLQLALLAGGTERLMTVREAYAEGRLPRKPRTFEHWLVDPNLRRQWRLDILLERVGARYFTSPARIEKWKAALAEREKKAKGAGSTPVNSKAVLPDGQKESTSERNNFTTSA